MFEAAGSTVMAALHDGTRRRAGAGWLWGSDPGAVASVCVRRTSASQGKACAGLGYAAASSPRAGGDGAPVSWRSSFGYVLWAKTTGAKDSGDQGGAHRGLGSG